MQTFAPLIKDLAIMLGLASLVMVIFRRIGQPVVLGYIIVGFIIGPHTPPYGFVTDVAEIHTLSELGVIFLMFYLGLEFSFRKLTRVGLSASFIGIFEVLLMMGIGYLTGRMLKFTYYDSLFLAAALSISSTTIIIKAIEELKLKTKRFAELIFGVLIVEDLLAILMLVALSTIVLTKNVFSMGMLYAALKLILVVGSWFILGYFLMPPLFRRISSYVTAEMITIISVALCFLLVWFAASFHYTPALGAFIMGSILAETVLINRIEKSVRPIRDIFAAVFFITVGMQIDPQVIAQYWPHILLLSLVTIVGKIISTFIGAFATGQSLNTSVRVGFSMAQIGEFSFIIAALGLMLNVTSNKLFPLIIAVSGITTFTTPYLIRLSGVIVSWLNRSLSENAKFLLNNYSAWVYRTQLDAKENLFLRNILVRICINGLLIAVIFSIMHYIVPRTISVFPEKHSIENAIFLLLALIVASPFIWGMLFSYKSANKLKISFLLVIGIWLLTLSEIAVLTDIYFKTWIALVVYVLIAISLFIVLYRQLESSYQWFEKQLIGNINVHDLPHVKYHDLAPWDTHLVEIEVGDKSPLIDKPLRTYNIRNEYGINVVAIAHGTNIIPAPRGEEVILAHDRLIILGNDEQIDVFRKLTDPHTQKHELINMLDHFALQPYFVEEGDELVGKTIRDSNIRENLKGLVVGLERENKHILNPRPDTKLKTGDLLLIVGPVRMKRKKRKTKE